MTDDAPKSAKTTDCTGNQENVIQWLNPAFMYRTEDVRNFLEVSTTEWKRWLKGGLGKNVIPGTKRDFIMGHHVIQYMENRRADSEGDQAVRAPALRMPMDGPAYGQD